MNPSKFQNPERFRTQVRALAKELGVPGGVRFYDTSVEDSGLGQARQAVADGCTIVLAAGGDGTVRKVAAGVAGSEASLGIVPAGTGNLFARNLDLPIDDALKAVRVAITGTPRPMDLGWLGFGHSAEAAHAATPEPFLVIAGYGFDAMIMEATDSTLKKYLGWVAYAVAGAKKLTGRSQSISLTLDGRRARPLTARTVMIGNVGRLPGGLTLMPGADAANGSLEVLALDWRGAAGFGQIVRQMVAPGSPSLARISHKRTFQARRMCVSTDTELPVQVDGDALGYGTHLEARVQAHALCIRTAAS